MIFYVLGCGIQSEQSLEEARNELVTHGVPRGLPAFPLQRLGRDPS